MIAPYVTGGAVTMGKVARTLQVKKLVPIDSVRYPAVLPVDAHVVLAEVFDKATTIWDRHYPIREKVAEGKRCLFLEPVEGKNKIGSFVMFHAYFYTAGHTPDQIAIDFEELKAKITAEPITDENGREAKVLERFACLVYGETLIVEAGQVAGSQRLAVAAIRDLVRRHVNPKFANMNLVDAPNRGFLYLAASKGGVKKVVARVASSFTPEAESFGGALEAFIKSKNLGKTKVISATIEAADDEPLDPDKILEMVHEREGATGLSGISVVFNDDSSLGEDLDEYRERARVEVQAVRPGVPVISEIETEMVNYLKRLASPDDENLRIIDSQGKFIAA